MYNLMILITLKMLYKNHQDLFVWEPPWFIFPKLFRHFRQTLIIKQWLCSPSLRMTSSCSVKPVPPELLLFSLRLCFLFLSHPKQEQLKRQKYKCSHCEIYWYACICSYLLCFSISYNRDCWYKLTIYTA